MKIYAKTLPPETTYADVEDCFDFKGLGVCLGKNRDFCDINFYPVETAEKLCNDLYYDDAYDACSYDKADGSQFTDEEFAELTKIAKDPSMGWGESVEAFILAFLALYFNKKNYRRVTLKGCCQSDWIIAYAPEEVSDELLNEIEAYYFNLGTEVIVDDTDRFDVKPEDIEGCSMYITSTDDDEIKKRIAEECGVKPEDVVLYIFDGYTQTPKYRL